MHKRKLRLVKRTRHLRTLQFPVQISQTLRGEDALVGIAEAFDAHKCKLVDSSQNASRIVRKSMADK
jgi:hypothetical protein